MPYLRFNNLDLKQTKITAHCSLCDRQFKDEVRAGERTEDTVLRIRREYEEHTCVVQPNQKLPTKTR